MSAEIISLCERRAAYADAEPHADTPAVDLMTAIDVAIRDLCEIEALCDTREARRRAAECRQMLVLALCEA